MSIQRDSIEYTNARLQAQAPASPVFRCAANVLADALHTRETCLWIVLLDSQTAVFEGPWRGVSNVVHVYILRTAVSFPLEMFCLTSIGMLVFRLMHACLRSTLCLALLPLLFCTVVLEGFSVDYATHTTHAFCHCMGQKRGLRAFEAVLLVGGPLLHCALSTQLAVIPLAFVDSPVLSVFFKMTTLVIVVGVTHGLMLLPVLLSLIGPMQQSQQKMVQQLLALQKQYDRLEEHIVACGGSRENPNLRKQRKALRRLIEQQEQPPETAKDACVEFAMALCPNHPKNVFLKNEQVRRWVQHAN